MFLAAIAVIAILAFLQSRSEGEGASRDALPEWEQTVEEHVPNASGPAGLPPIGNGGTDYGSEEDAWIAYYKSHGKLPPPEYPKTKSDVGVQGDIPGLSDAEENVVVKALFEDNDVSSLLSLADELDERGHEMVANRLRQKAVRVVSDPNQGIV